MNENIKKLFENNNNMITTEMVVKAGFSRMTLSLYEKQGLIVRVRQGVYVLKDSLHDDMYSLVLCAEGFVFSHETALFLNGLSSRTPFVHSVTVPTGKELSPTLRKDCKCFYVKPELFDVGIVERNTTFGNTVKCYDSERTLCDIIRSKNRIDYETVISAIKNYLSSEKKNLNTLSEYSKYFRVQDKVRTYLEVLL